jgi:hypothetical protein
MLWKTHLSQRLTQARVAQDLQLKTESKKSRMCPGTIKILHTHGCIERIKDHDGVSIMVGSPIAAG